MMTSYVLNVPESDYKNSLKEILKEISRGDNHQEFVSNPDIDVFYVYMKETNERLHFYFK